MRLLEYGDDGEISLAKPLPSNKTPPPYAILSHTWGEEGDEVIFKDFIEGKASCKAKCKPGYDKIRFCARQARRDGLRYFWVDTCCIDKSSSAELSQEIRSMFRHYRNATLCYVYLSGHLFADH